MKAAVIGNGPSAISPKRGADIELCDVVVRVNRYRISGYEEALGSRTDIWVTDLRPADLPPPEGIANVKEVWTFPWAGMFPRVGEGRESACPDKTPIPTTEAEFMRLNAMIPGRKWPSNGLGAIALVLWRLQPRQLLLSGFDALLNPDVPAYCYYWGDRSEVCNLNHDLHAENAALRRLIIEAGCELAGGCVCLTT